MLDGILDNSYDNRVYIDIDQQTVYLKSIGVDVESLSEQQLKEYNTKDKVFLLSIDEAEKYLPLYEDRQAEGTEYAKTTKLYVEDNGYSSWWLRSPGVRACRVAYVGEDGHVYQDSIYRVDYDEVGVRPALWIDTSKLK